MYLKKIETKLLLGFFYIFLKCSSPLNFLFKRKKSVFLDHSLYQDWAPFILKNEKKKDSVFNIVSLKDIRLEKKFRFGSIRLGLRF